MMINMNCRDVYSILQVNVMSLVVSFGPMKIERLKIARLYIYPIQNNTTL